LAVVNNEKHNWDGTIDRFVVLRNIVEGHYGLILAGYLFDLSFQEEYLDKDVDCYVDFLYEVQSACQINKDARALYGTFFIAYHCGVGRRILIENRSTQGSIRSCYQLVKQYDSHNNEKLGSRSLKMLLPKYFIVTTRVDCLNEFKTMKMHRTYSSWPEDLD
jgi:hypothetical protein